MQRFLPPLLFLICVAVAVAFGRFVPVLESPSGLLRLVGAPLLAAGVLLTMRNAAAFGRLGTNINTFDDPDVLVQEGAFRWTRNPMYVGFTLALVGIAVLVGSVAAFVGPAVFWVSADRWYIPFEERRMQPVFGRAYDDYCRAVPRWLGRLGSVPAK